MSSRAMADSGYQELMGQVLAGQVGLQQVWVEAAVLDKYLEADGYQVLRTDSAGRLRRGRAWSLDFGIAERTDGRSPLLHLPAQDLANRLPAAESDHWLAHLMAPPTSANFLKMQLHPEACIGDGEIRGWDKE